ncbi:MAG: glycoside hydrolase [Actinomycetota bacterium]|nr:glycoside hydrolase [Actinomycetota bacterium]
MRRTAWVPLLALGFVPVAMPASAVKSCDGVVNVSKTPGRGEGEESLSVNPRNPKQILVGSNQFEPTGPSSPISAGGLMEAASWVSQDGGCTWRALGLETLGGLMDVTNPVPLGPAEYRNIGNVVSSDQHSAWGSDGTLYYEAGFLGGLGVDGDQRAMVWRSRDGGRTFDKPVTAYSSNANEAPDDSTYPDTVPELDRPWLAVDRSGGPRHGTVYMTLATGPFALGLPAEVYVLSSRDHGRTWSRTTRADTGTYSTQLNPREMPAVGKDGVLYVVYDVAGPDSTVLPVPQARPISIYVARSSDDGRTFTRSVVDADVHRVTSPDEALPVYVETITSIAADPVSRGHLAIAWPEADSPTSSHVVVRTSTDGGRHWGPRQRVGGAEQDQQDHVTLSYTPKGELVVVWRDRGASGGTWLSDFQVWARILGHRPVQVTAGPQPLASMQRGGPTMPSEFMGVDTTSSHLLVSWDQMVGSLPDNVFRAIPLARLR